MTKIEVNVYVEIVFMPNVLMLTSYRRKQTTAYCVCIWIRLALNFVGTLIRGLFIYRYFINDDVGLFEDINRKLFISGTLYMSLYTYLWYDCRFYICDMAF